MRIKPDEVVAGFPARKIRELLRQSVDSLSARHATKILEIKTKEATQLLERLEQRGFLEKNPALPDFDDEQSWKRTVKGGALANALFSTPVSRQSAEKTMSEFLDRVRQVNFNSRFLYRVRKVVVFGSFLSDAPFVGDLDLAVDLSPKEKDSRKHSELIRARANEAASCGRRFRNHVDGLRFAEKEVTLFLKARSRILQLTRCDDGVLNITESRVIYESPEQNPAVPMNPLPKQRVRRSRKSAEDLPF
jgi:DNA-binding MarR family transcriptional regulator